MGILSTLLRLLFQLGFAFFCVLYTGVTKLRYDEFDVACEYHRAWSNGLMGHIMTPSLVLFCEFIVLSLVAAVDDANDYLQLIQIIIAVFAMIPVWIRMETRCNRQMQVLSVRYMERKYGANVQQLMALLDRDGHNPSTFPITFFEKDVLQLTEDQKKASVIEDETVRTRAINELAVLYQAMVAAQEFKKSIQRYDVHGRWWHGDQQPLYSLLSRLHREATAVKSTTMSSNAQSQ